MTILFTFFVLQTCTFLLCLFKKISTALMVNFLRFSYGFFLIFSGSVKLIDPLGFSYKLQEYFEVFGMEFLVPSSLFLAVFVIIFEIALAVCLMLGVKIKEVVWGNLLLMLFFTFLTFFSAYFNKVTDCGCFGDFMKLDPWHSFFKDLHLVFVSIVLFVYQNRIKSFWSLKRIILILILSAIGLFVFTFYTLTNLPVVDFRAYKIGTNIIEDRQLPANAKKDVYEDVWFYEIDGVVKEYSTSDKPWEIKGAKFKDRETKLIFKGDSPAINDFDIIDENKGVDLTDSILSMNKVFLVISYDIEKTSVVGHKKINQKMLEISNNNNIEVFGLSSSSLEEIRVKLKDSELFYDYLSVDQTTLKTIVRSNPGLILIEKGIVVNKWNWRDIPNDIGQIIN